MMENEARHSPIYFAQRQIPLNDRQKIKILIVDDHPIYRRELRQACETEKDLQIIGETENGRQAIQMAEQLKPDIILMDINLPFVDGIQATRHILHSNPEARIIVLTVYRDAEHIYEAMQAGAKAHLNKDISAEELVQTIRAVYHGEARVDSQITAVILAELRKLSE